MNILITSAGRRTYMVRYFREALKGEGKVYAANSRMSPALFAADGYFITPLIYTDSYIPFLIGKCRELKIDMLISLFDADLPVLSAHRSEFEEAGTFLAMPYSGAVDIANDKLLMYKELSKEGIKVPVTSAGLSETAAFISRGLMHYPLIVKPRYGMGSMGVIEAHDETELKAAFSMCAREIKESYLSFEAEKAPGLEVITMESIRGQEYGIDVVSDFKGELRAVFTRKKEAMRAGETDEAIVLGPEDKEYGALRETGAKIAKVLKPLGLIDVDAIIPFGRETPYVIDINARFGGGYPFSHLAGADVPRAYVLFYRDRVPEAMRCLNVTPGTHGYKEIELKVREDE